MDHYILIVEDDNDINAMLKELLEQAGYSTAQAFSGTEALLYLEKEHPLAVILDLMLPGMEGEEVLQRIKESNPQTAVIVTSAKDGTKTRVDLLKAGADDYMVKPYDTEEFLARLEAVLRRSVCDSPGGREKKKLAYRDLLMDREEFLVFLAGEELKLTRREFLILELFMENPGKVFTKSNIYESVWNEEFLGEDNAVNVHISNIRQKIAKIKGQDTYIETVWGIGFKMS